MLSKAAVVKTHRLGIACQRVDNGGMFLGHTQRITDGRTHRYSSIVENQPEEDHQLLLQRLHLVLPPQPPPRIARQDESLAAEARASAL